MTTKNYNFTGKIKWTQNLRDPDHFQDNTFWKVGLYGMDEANEAKFHESGIRVRPKTDDEGDTYYNLKRDTKKMIGGEMKEFSPPIIIGPDGNPFDGFIPFGSTAVVNVQVYDSKAGKGHRLQGVKILELAEMEGDGESFEADKPLDKSIFE